MIGFTTLWVVTFGAISVVAFASDMTAKSFSLGLGLIGGLLGTVLLGNLKSVTVEDDVLIVSNCWRQVRVPVTEVASVSQSQFINPRTVTLWLSRPTELGQSVSFVPAGFLWPYSAARIVEILITHGARQLG